MITLINKFILAIMLFVMPINVLANTSNLKEEYQRDLYKAKVLEVVEENKYNDTIVQVLLIEVDGVDNIREEVTINNTLSGNDYDIKLSDNDRIMVTYENGSYYFKGYDKSMYLTVLVTIFVISILVLGGMKGFKALLSLVVTILLIVFVLVPLLLKGYDPISLSIITCIVATTLTFLITNGFTRKTLIAIIGVTGGLVVGGIIAYSFGVLAKITGFSSEYAQMLMYLPSGVEFDFKGLLFAGIIIGALGACMDVAMELTSSLYEIKEHKPKISNDELAKSGFNIGKDIMGTMVNTLILAYTGGSLSTILVFVGFEKNFSEIINLESISTEIIRAISGSMGLLFAIPITIYAFIYINKRGLNNEKNK